MRGLQRGFDAERPARGDLVGQPDPRFQRRGRVGGDLLDQAHPVGLLRAPVVAGEHVPHGVAPSRFPREPDGRAAAGEPSVRVLVLAKPHVGAGHPNVDHQMQFVAHVPGIAVDDRDQGLAELLGPGEGVEHAILDRERLAGLGQGREGVHVDAAGEVPAVAEEHRRPQARVVVEIVVRLGQAEEGVRVEPVVDLGPVDPDQDDLAAPLDGDLGLGGDRNIGHTAFVVELGNGHLAPRRRRGFLRVYLYSLLVVSWGLVTGSVLTGIRWPLRPRRKEAGREPHQGLIWPVTLAGSLPWSDGVGLLLVESEVALAGEAGVCAVPDRVHQMVRGFELWQVSGVFEELEAGERDGGGVGAAVVGVGDLVTVTP